MSLLSDKKNLLYAARIDRLKWILDAADSKNENIKKFLKRQPIYDTPAMQCVQDVISFLTNVIGDSDEIDLFSIVPMIGLGEDSVIEKSIPAYYDKNIDAYSTFIERLLHPQAIEIVKVMQTFLLKLRTRIDVQRSQQRDILTEHQHTEICREVSSFLLHLNRQMRESVLWAADSNSQWETAVESSEKFLFVKLHPILTKPDVESCRLDQQLADRIASLQFLAPKHLDVYSPIPPIVEAAAWLTRMQEMRCPADKIACVRRCCMDISKAVTSGQTEDATLPGADEILPLLILTVKHANPPQLASQLLFLQRYTPSQRLVSESGYLLTQFYSAVR